MLAECNCDDMRRQRRSSASQLPRTSLGTASAIYPRGLICNTPKTPRPGFRFAAKCGLNARPPPRVGTSRPNRQRYPTSALLPTLFPGRVRVAPPAALFFSRGRRQEGRSGGAGESPAVASGTPERKARRCRRRGSEGVRHGTRGQGDAIGREGIRGQVLGSETELRQERHVRLARHDSCEVRPSEAGRLDTDAEGPTPPAGSDRRARAPGSATESGAPGRAADRGRAPRGQGRRRGPQDRRRPAAQASRPLTVPAPGIHLARFGGRCATPAGDKRLK